MHPVKFYKLAKELEEKLFPNLIVKEHYLVGHDETDIWDYAAPSYHFIPPKALITEKIVQDIKQNNKKLLDACCGPAYLEQLLILGFGVNLEQINIADISSKDIPLEFKYFKFDIFNEWPKLEGPYDYIIFPSYPTPCSNTNLENSINMQYASLTNALNILKPDGQIRISGAFICAREIKEQIESEFQNVKMNIFPELIYLTKK